MTEAECLLNTGALYGQRVGIRRPDGGLTFAGIKRGAFSLYLDDAPIVHFDLEGRWQRAFFDGIHYRKALGNAVDAIDRVREGEELRLSRRALPFGEIADLDALIRDQALAIGEGLATGSMTLLPPPDGVRPLSDADLREICDRIGRWDAAAWFVHREKYLATYAPLGFTPPNSLGSVVFQASVGDARPRGFGGARTLDHATRSPEEFRSHVKAVMAFLGRRVEQANGVFLAGGDLLDRPLPSILDHLEAIRSAMPDAPIDVFLDHFEDLVPGATDWGQLRAAGLRRVNLGLESGDPDLARLYGSTGDLTAARSVIEGAKRAGLATALVMLADAGGRDGAEAHRKRTVEFLESLPLGRGDLVHLIAASEFSGEAPPEGVEPLAPPEVMDQVNRLKDRLATVRDRGAKVSLYTTEKAMA